MLIQRVKVEEIPDMGNNTLPHRYILPGLGAE